MYIRYPDPPKDASLDLQKAWGELIHLLELKDRVTFFGSANPGSSLYILSNVSVNRTFDVSVASTSVANVANVLGTLLNDLQTKGLIA